VAAETRTATTGCGGNFRRRRLDGKGRRQQLRVRVSQRPRPGIHRADPLLS
jgi:hypothetical protein